MKFGLMDNRQVHVLAETKDELGLAVALAMAGRKGVGFVEHNDGLVVFWHTEQGDGGSVPFAYDHTPEQVVDMAWNWLEANRDKRRGEYDDGCGKSDVWNHHAFQLDTNGWGHAYDPDSDATWSGGCFFVRPVAAWVGK